MKRISKLLLFITRGTVWRYVLYTIMIVMCFLAAGCSKKGGNAEKIKDLEYTVVEDADIPKELKDIINEKKAQPFKMNFSNKESLYIVVGFGEQPSGGYSIAVEDLYLTKNAVVIDTNLIGPSENDMVTQVVTYPYIVVKLEFIDLPTEFR